MFRLLSVMSSLIVFFTSYSVQAEPQHWLAKKGDMEYMIIGSVHVGDKTMYPLPKAVTQFLNATAESRRLSTELLQWLKEDRATAHRERINATRRDSRFQPGDIVTEVNDTRDDVQFVVEGRIKVVRVVGDGNELLFGMAGQSPGGATVPLQIQGPEVTLGAEDQVVAM